jgi:DNA-directed RNA polymerase specialized sigma24 family protein
MMSSAPWSGRLERALSQLSPLQRELVCALAAGDDEEEMLAETLGLTPSALRLEQILARKRLAELLAASER